MLKALQAAMFSSLLLATMKVSASVERSSLGSIARAPTSPTSSPCE